MPERHPGPRRTRGRKGEPAKGGSGDRPRGRLGGYHGALGYLAEQGALLGDEHTEMHTEEVEGPQPHAYAVYVYTGRALVLLEEAERTRSTTLDSEDPNSYPEAY